MGNSSKKDQQQSHPQRVLNHYDRVTDWRHVTELAYDDIATECAPFDLLCVRSPTCQDKCVRKALPNQPECGLVTHVGLLINHSVYADARLEKGEWYVLEYLDSADGDTPDIFNQFESGVQIRSLRTLLHNNRVLQHNVYLLCPLRPQARRAIDIWGMHEQRALEQIIGRKARLGGGRFAATTLTDDNGTLDQYTPPQRIDDSSESNDDNVRQDDVSTGSCCCCCCRRGGDNDGADDPRMHPPRKYASSADFVFHVYSELRIIAAVGSNNHNVEALVIKRKKRGVLLPVDFLPGVDSPPSSLSSASLGGIIANYRMRRLIMRTPPTAEAKRRSYMLVDETLE